MSNATLQRLPASERRSRKAAYNWIHYHNLPHKDECQICGRRTKLEGHHVFGHEIAIVIWLCRRCHFREDAKQGSYRRDSHGRFIGKVTQEPQKVKQGASR